MIEHGFQPDFPAGTDKELGAIQAHPEPPAVAGIQDLRSLLWSSIDNDTSQIWTRSNGLSRWPMAASAC